MHDLLREGDGLGKAVGEKAEEGSHLQWRERKTQVGVGVTNTSSISFPDPSLGPIAGHPLCLLSVYNLLATLHHVCL